MKLKIQRKVFLRTRQNQIMLIAIEIFANIKTELTPTILYDLRGIQLIGKHNIIVL